MEHEINIADYVYKPGDFDDVWGKDEKVSDVEVELDKLLFGFIRKKLEEAGKVVKRK